MQPLSNDLRKRILEAVDNKDGSRYGSKSTRRPSPNCSNPAVRPALTSPGPTVAGLNPPSTTTPYRIRRPRNRNRWKI